MDGLPIKNFSTALITVLQTCLHGGGLVAKSCPTCNPMDCSLPGSSVHGVLQARILDWVAISFSRGSSWIRSWTHISCIGRRILYPWATGDTFYKIKLQSSESRNRVSSDLGDIHRPRFRDYSGIQHGGWYEHGWVYEVASVMSDSLQHYGLYPTRFLCPWDSPGKKYWSGLPSPSPGDLPPGIEPRSLRFFTTSATWEALVWTWEGTKIFKAYKAKQMS